MHAATIVARNYLPYARVLATSFLRHHPTATFSTLLLDGTAQDRDDADLPGDVVLVTELGLETEDWHRMAAVYSVVELATALKPAFLRALLGPDAGGGDEPVVYLDPDVEVVAPFPEVFAAVADNGIALTPHVLCPIPRDGLAPTEMIIRHSGIFNLGFIGVAPSAMSFLDWWHDRLTTDAIVDLPNALFTDQRWIDWVPALFPHTILRDPGLNVAYWNLHERPLSAAADGTVLADGSALKFVHFSGFDPDTPARLSKHAGDRPRVRLGDEPTLDALAAAYRSRLVDAGFDRRTADYRFDHSVGGHRLDHFVRRGFRQCVVAAARGEGDFPPDPFDESQAAAFAEWLDAPAVGPRWARLSSWTIALHESRPDLQHAFPNLAFDDAFRYRNWLNHDPYATALRAAIGLAPLDDQRSLPRSSSRREPGGWNVVGYHGGEMGVGEAGRRMNAAVERVGLPTQLVTLDAPNTRNDHPSNAFERELRYVDTIYCVNADVTPTVLGVLEHPDRTRDDARRIGLWFWEIGVFPLHYAASFEFFEQIWVTSEFTRDALAAVSPVPVQVVPLPVLAPSRPTPYRRNQLGLPEDFLYLNVFDFNSVLERKNPLDVVDAYTRAFGPDDGTSLLLKSINGAKRPADLERVERAIASRPDVHLVDAHWTADEMQGLIELCDCFVSLHRSEGFGLNLAAAMAAARPTVATGYSGNMTFMDETAAFLVPYTLVAIGPNNAPYPTDAVWAQPDVGVAADRLRRVFDDRSHAAAVAARGRDRVLDGQSLDRAAAALGPILNALDLDSMLVGAHR